MRDSSKQRSRRQPLCGENQCKIDLQGNLAVEVESLKTNVAETKKSLVADQELSTKLAESCSSQSSECEERQKSRVLEHLAIYESMKLLNDDDALELFKSTVPAHLKSR